MKKAVLKIILIIIVLVFAIGVVLGSTLHNNRINISQTKESIEYYINGESELLRFGVAGNGNLFKPDETIKVVLECCDESLSGY